MSYCIDIKINKPISKEETEKLLENFPDYLKPFGTHSRQYWGFSDLDMDVMFDDNEAPKKTMTLHAAYGQRYETFLIESIKQLCDAGYRITGLKFDI